MADFSQYLLDKRVDFELKLHAVQRDLDMEKEKRAAAERALNSAEKECREPFVVPALFEAFLKISKLTNEL